MQEEQRHIERAARLHWFHWLVVAGSLLLTLGAWQISRQSIEEKIALQFDREARQAVELVTERLEKYEDALWAGVAAIHANGGDIGYERWQIFAERLRIDIRHPGINGIGVIHYVPPTGLAEYLSEQRQTRPEYRVHPVHQKKEYWPITLIEPVALNREAVGLDMAHETNRHTAAMRARDSARARITAPITLVQDSDRTPGFLFFAPFYQDPQPSTLQERRERFTGLVYAPFVVKNLMEGTLREENRLVGIRIIDSDQVLYDEHRASSADFDASPRYSKQYEVDLYGRSWIFDVRAKKRFRDATDSAQPMIILFGGIIIDTLLLILFVLLANANQRAVSFIHRLLDYRQE